MKLAQETFTEVSCARSFQSQPTNQTAQFWSHAIFLYKFIEHVSPYNTGDLTDDLYPDVEDRMMWSEM